ncbi:hypothetical protein D3C76_943510 [compost metagenome]
MIFLNLGCMFGANRKTIPIFSISSSMPSLVILIFTPKEVNKSADPLFDDIDLLPCLATFTPPAANRKLLVVDILKLPLLSPPVPQLSKRPSIFFSFMAFSLMPSAIPAISS